MHEFILSDVILKELIGKFSTSLLGLKKGERRAKRGKNETLAPFEIPYAKTEKILESNFISLLFLLGIRPKVSFKDFKDPERSC